MQNVWRRTMNYSVYRHLCTSGALCKDLTVSKQAKILRKLMEKSMHKTDVDPFALPIPRPGTNSFIRTHQTPKRIAILNKIMTGHITDLLSTGDVAPEVLERGILINDIEVKSNLNVIRVYWYHSDMYNDEVDKELEQILVHAGHQLRSKLSELNVIGLVPPIRFVKDKYAALEKQLEKRQLIADYGEDYVPQTYKTLRTETVGENHEETVEEVEESLEDEFHETLPVMRHDVLGIDHCKIMSKIAISTAKARNATKQRSRQINDANSQMMSATNLNALIEEQEVQQRRFLEHLKEMRKQHKKQKKARNWLDVAEANEFESEDQFEDHELRIEEVDFEDGLVEQDESTRN